MPYSTTQATRVERILLLCSSKIQNSPIHRSRFCCGREPVRKERLTVRIGVHRVEDRHHPREYRELRSPAEMRKLLNWKIIERDRKCAICREEFTDYHDCRTIRIRRVWEERGETTSQTMSKQRIGGARGKKGRLGLTDGRSVEGLGFRLRDGSDVCIRRDIAGAG